MTDCELDQSMVLKKDSVGKRLQEREDERVREANRKKEDTEKAASKSEKTDVFMETLTAGVAVIKEGLAKASIQEKSSLGLYFDNLSSKMAEIQKFVTDSSMFLSSYDLAQKQQQLNELQSEIALSQSKLMPKNKFSFKNRQKQTTTSSSEPGNAVQLTNQKLKESEGTSLAKLSANEYRVSSRTNEVIQVTEEDTENKDVVVSSISGCTMHVTGTPSAMHLIDLVNTNVLAGPCGRSIFIENCSNCVFVLACQQLRVHKTVNCKFFIHVTSRAIIEDSNGLKFAPYKLSYEGIDEHHKNSGLSQQINNWYDVDDFNWLVSNKQSPNWSVLPEEEWLTHLIE